MQLGMLFHSLGAMTLNDLAANVCSLMKGTTSHLYSELDLSSCSLMAFTVNRLHKYSGAWSFRHLYVNVSSLKLILIWMGNQWSLIKQSVTLFFAVFPCNVAPLSDV